MVRKLIFAYFGLSFACMATVAQALITKSVVTFELLLGWMVSGSIFVVLLALGNPQLFKSIGKNVRKEPNSTNPNL